MKGKNSCSPRAPRFEALEARSLLNADSVGLGAFEALRVDPGAFNTSQILVRYRPETVSDLEATGAAAGSALGQVPGLRAVPLADGMDVETALAAFQNDPQVLYAQPDYVVHLDAAVTPSDPRFSNGGLWGLNNNGRGGGKADADIDAPEAWGVTTGTGRTIVAVIDSGVDYTHPDLSANMWVNRGEIAGNRIDDDGNGYIDDVHGYDFANDDSDPMDDNGHGTHVAGTIGAVGNNGRGVVGVAWKTRIMALKFLDASGVGFLSHAIDALDYAMSMGATVSNHSYTGGWFDRAFADALARARAAGHIVVAAAGNDGQDNDALPSFPSSYGLDNVVAVAATDRKDALAGFSNYGVTSVDLGAPGVGIVSTKPGGQYRTLNGTSMAAPHVTGAIALVRDRHPNWSYRQVIGRVLSTVDPIPALDGKTATGGRLNVGSALAPLTSRIIDDGDAGFSTSGTWLPWSKEGRGDDIRYSAAGTGADVATWTFTVTPGRTYRVAATWHPLGNRATNSPYRLYDGSTLVDTVRVNQKLAPNDFTVAGSAWETLGTITASGSTLQVKLGDDANLYVIADAIRIEEIPTTRPIATRTGTVGGSPATGGAGHRLAVPGLSSVAVAIPVSTGPGPIGSSLPHLDPIGPTPPTDVVRGLDPETLTELARLLARGRKRA